MSYVTCASYTLNGTRMIVHTDVNSTAMTSFAVSAFGQHPIARIVAYGFMLRAIQSLRTMVFMR